jgi:hypothetical protein
VGCSRVGRLAAHLPVSEGRFELPRAANPTRPSTHVGTSSPVLPVVPCPHISRSRRHFHELSEPGALLPATSARFAARVQAGVVSG